MPTTGSLRMRPNGRIELQSQHEAGFYFAPKGQGILFNFDLNYGESWKNVTSWRLPVTT